MKPTALLSLCALLSASAVAQDKAPLPPLPPPQSVPRPSADTGGPYAPQAILPGGVVVPLFPPDSPYLKAEKLHVPEVYNMSQAVPGRISSIVSIHNPSIEVHRVERSINTGTAVIVIAGGGHRTLNVGGEAADFVPFFYNYGINTVILRNRLRADGYVAEVDAVHDAQQAVRVVRAYAKEWGIDTKKIGVMGFSAGAELAAPAAVLYDDWDNKNNHPADPFAGISSRPDFAGIIYPGPTPFARNRSAPPVPKDVPPAFLVCGSAGDRVHTVWALDYYQAMLMAGVPNVELHLYGNGRHPGDPLPDGSRMSGGLTDRNGIPFGTWQYRFIDWARDLGFLQKPGIETKAAKDVASYVANPPRPFGAGRGATPRQGAAPARPGAAPSGAAQASTAVADEPGFRPLLNGKDLSGWRLGYSALAGKTVSDDGRFAVNNGILVISASRDKPPKITEIDSMESYDGDFTLRLEFRASKDANSGLHLRDKAFAHQLQIRDYPRVGPYKSLKGYRDGDWNAIEVVVTGTKARCTCNGELLEAALEIPASGPLALQSETNVVEYRNVRVKRVAQGMEVKRDILYAAPPQDRQVLDVYSPPRAKNRPVVFWIHGGGWETGDKSSVQQKPQAFTDKGFVFVSTNYRLLPHVDMVTIVRDIAQAIRWVHDHIAEYGGNPRELLIMGHSAGAQLAALVCTDDRYLQAEGLSLAIIKGCVPVDGDTYDVPAIIETAETRRRAHGLPQVKYGHREKFGNDPAMHRDLSAVTHVARTKGIPPFLIMHVAGHPDTSAQAEHFANVLKAEGVSVTLFGARESTHNKINADLGLPDDPGTKALFEFVSASLNK